MKLRKKGFGLIEIMSAVAIIGFLAAIAIPNLMRSRINANEAAAQVTLKTINNALEAYYSDQASPSYPPNLTTLANANPPYIVQEIANNSAALTPSTLFIVSGFGGYKGYVFRYEPTLTGTRIYTYTLYALPVEESKTGSTYFSMSASGDIVKTTKDAATGTPTEPN